MGGAHDAQGLLLRRVGQEHCRDDHEGDRRVDGRARSVELKDYLSGQHVESRKLSRM